MDRRLFRGFTLAGVAGLLLSGCAPRLTTLQLASGERPSAAAQSAGTQTKQSEQAHPARQRRLLAIGGSVRFTVPPSDELDSKVSFGPLFRIGAGKGLRPAVGFGWFDTTAHLDGTAPAVRGRLEVKPIMVGVGYNTQGDHLSVSVSIVAGAALNRLSVVRPNEHPEIGFDIDNSFAWRPGISLWYDLNSRMAFNVFNGYLVSRPRMTIRTGEDVVSRRLSSNAFILTAGLAYKVY